MKLWESGQGIVLREVWREKVYSVTPVRVVQDSSSWTALYRPPHTSNLWPHTREGETIRIPQDDWVLDGGTWPRGLFTVEQVRDLYQRGERGIQAIMANDPPFDANWENWRPNPALRVPLDLPEGWQRV